MSLEQEFQAYLDTQRLKADFSNSEAYKKFQADQAQGGSINNPPEERNFPVGSVVGGAVGAIGGFAAAGPAGAMAGAGAGSALGELAQQGVEHLIRSPGAPSSLEESFRRAVEEGLTSTVSELSGPVRLVRKLGKPFAAEAGVEDAEKLAKFLPGEASTSRILDVGQNVAEYSLFGGGKIKEFKAQREQMFEKLADNMVSAFGVRAQPDEIGRAVVESAKGNLETSTAPAKMIYQMIDKAVAPDYAQVPQRMQVIRTDTPQTKEVIKKVTANKDEVVTSPSLQSVERGTLPTDKGFVTPEETQLKGMNVKTEYQQIPIGDRLERLKVMTTTQERQVGGAQVDMAPLKVQIANMIDVARRSGGLEDRAMGTTLLKFIDDKPDVVSYQVAKQLRTEVRTLQSSLEKSIENKNAPAIGKAKVIYQGLTERIEAGLREYDPFIADMWKDANFIERGGQLQFNNKVLRKLTMQAMDEGGAKAEAITQNLVKPGNITAIRNVKNAVDAPTFEKLQGYTLNDLIERSRLDGKISGAELEKRMFGPEGLGAQTMQTVFTPEQVGTYKAFINALKLREAKQSEGTGRLLVQLSQGGALINLAGNVTGLSETGHELESGAILLTPFVLAHMMTNPKTARWLIHGMSLPKGSEEAGLIAGRLLHAAFPRSVGMGKPQETPAPTAAATGAKAVSPFALQE